MESENQMMDVLKALGKFYYLPNAGNLGDQVIAYATRDFFRRNGLNFLPYSSREAEKTEGEAIHLVYGGGGGFVPYYGMAPVLAEVFRDPRLKKIVILPSSFYECDALADSLDERFTVFCREKRSFDYLASRNKRAEILMADDMAFSLDVRTVLDSMPDEVTSHAFFREKTDRLRDHLHILEDGRKALLLMRGDIESRYERGKIGRGRQVFDLSGLSNGNAQDEQRNQILTCLFLYGLEQADIVLTDRLHGAICSTLLGKETWMLDNNYGKLSGVYAYSMQGYEQTRFIRSLDEFPYNDEIARQAEKHREKPHILVGICSAQKYADRRTAVRETWLKHQQEGIRCLFFLGGEAPEDEKEDTIGLDAPDSYNGLPAKVLAFFRYALEHYEFDWLFKCDEDTYLDLSRLPELADPQYGIVGDVLLARRNAPSGGAGYLLKREIVERIAARQDVPACGAEDLIFGKLALEEGAVPHSTSRLYMSNAHYPSPDNGEISAHWCMPELMKTFEILRHGTPAAFYRAKHEKWQDELLIYKEGIFRRRSTPGYGWWSLSPSGTLTLRWKDGREEQFLSSEKGYSGSNLELSPADGSATLEKLAQENGSGESIFSENEIHEAIRLHLGCGERQLRGWLNLDLPRYDITRPLPWANGSVEAFYLEHVLEYVSPEELCRFLKEVRRTLQTDGVLRLSVTDRVRHTAETRLNYAPFRQQQTGASDEPDWELDALIGHDKTRSFWTQESLTSFLNLAGFDVTAHEPGESDNPGLQNLERKENPPEDPFLLQGTVCLEAKPRQHKE